jgi:xanthine/uracil permease
VFNGFPISAFAQNVGMVAMTGVRSRFVVAAGGGILVLLGLLPVLGRVMNAIPLPVLGGAGIVLFGSVAAAGIRTLSKVEFTNSNILIVAAAIGVGMIPITVPEVYTHLPDWLHKIFESGISACAIVAVVLNLLFNHFSRADAEPAADH